MAHSASPTPRTALICGPYLSGKSSLFEALLTEAGALQRHGDGLSLADQSPEAKAHDMSTEVNVATTDYLGESWTFIDCPGSVELMQDTRDALAVADVAVVVVEPDPAKVVTLSGHLRMLEDAGIPHVLFINKFDKRDVSARVLMEAFQSVSRTPLVLREVPIREGDQVTGFVDLVSERAFRWEEGKQHSSLIKMPETVLDRETEARTEMLEHLADFDDDLLEKLLEDAVPSTDEIYANLSTDLAQNKVVPVFFGSATNGHGIHRLMKALRHEAPDAHTTDERLGIAEDETKVKVFKTIYAGHAGKVSLARVLSGTLKSGDTLNGERPASIVHVMGSRFEPLQSAAAGDVVGLTKLDSAQTGDLLTAGGRTPETTAPAPLFSMAIKADNRSDDVKLPDALRKLIEEDPALSAEFDEVTGEQLLRGQGEMHLRLALERLKNRNGLTVEATMPAVAYRETIRKPSEKRVRHKKQSGGHGEFGEVELKIAPQTRGLGFVFTEQIHGGSVPRQYFSAVEAGVGDALANGPLGFPVVDVSVTLTDGKHHAVDSSEMAFRKAAGQAMREALADGKPVQLEPINQVSVYTPDSCIAAIQKIVLSRKGQIFGFENRDGWEGWNEVKCQIPAAEMQDLIVELRSATMGVGTFEAAFDHLQEM